MIEWTRRRRRRRRKKSKKKDSDVWLTSPSPSTTDSMQLKHCSVSSEMRPSRRTWYGPDFGWKSRSPHRIVGIGSLGFALRLANAWTTQQTCKRQPHCRRLYEQRLLIRVCPSFKCFYIRRRCSVKE